MSDASLDDVCKGPHSGWWGKLGECISQFITLLRDGSIEQPGLTDEFRAIRRSTSSRIRLLHFIIVTLAVTVLAIFLPAYIFMNVEPGWSYIDAVYFCFVSLTTIGLGDLVPSSQSWDGSMAPTVVQSIYHCVVIGELPAGVPFCVYGKYFCIASPAGGGAGIVRPTQ
ncbi:unnamed protein product [Dibothriocephalus latus]|uniref:Potassium channel domain-containing protein n=1 Tax=Dibothriocephalus latus TaxID=60516 RepID=A0A3P7REC8_DIBLA|nr:unnamed protein product [Dibothriocephalus latus]